MNKKKGLPLSIKSYFLHGLALFAGLGITSAAAYVALPALLSVSYTGPVEATSTPAAAIAAPAVPPAEHLKTPAVVKAIYMSQCVVGTPSFRNNLVKLIDDTELNAVVIDIRDFTGKISFPTDNPTFKDAVSDACGARDMRAFIATLHEKGIYVIGRITTFQNPYYTSLYPEQAVQRKDGGVWKDYKGLAFVDVSAQPYWDSVVELGKISYDIGFDELNFDYVRFPSDGPMSQAEYSWGAGKSKQESLEAFFKYLTDHLRPTGAVLSADLFGMTATNEDDLNIGQVLERALPYFDYVSPMVYPSHYPKGYSGYANVNDHPYEIVKIAMDTAVERAVATSTKISGRMFTPIASTTPQLYTKPSYAVEKIRPWLQSFDYPVVYTPAMVEAQIKAANDAGIESYLIWDAANKYTALRQVLKK